MAHHRQMAQGEAINMDGGMSNIDDKVEVNQTEDTDEDFTQTNKHGWTVSALLGHLAFWDQRMLVLLRRWQERGLDESPVDPDMINDSLRPICLALEPRAAADLCIASAKETDATLAEISPELYEAIVASPNHFRFDRSLHRDDHLDEIKRILRY